MRSRLLQVEQAPACTASLSRRVREAHPMASSRHKEETCIACNSKLKEAAPPRRKQAASGPGSVRMGKTQDYPTKDSREVGTKRHVHFPFPGPAPGDGTMIVYKRRRSRSLRGSWARGGQKDMNGPQVEPEPAAKMVPSDRSASSARRATDNQRTGGSSFSAGQPQLAFDSLIGRKAGGGGQPQGPVPACAAPANDRRVSPFFRSRVGWLPYPRSPTLREAWRRTCNVLPLFE